MPRDRRLTSAVAAYCLVCEDILTPIFRPGVGPCIGSTAITVATFEALRFNVRELPVDVVVEAPNGYTIGVRKEQPVDRGPMFWNGHLVTLVADRWIVDAATKQFCRPKHGLVVPGVIAAPVGKRALDDFTSGEGWVSGHINGSKLSYRGRPDNLHYQQSIDWRQRAEYKDVVSLMLTAMVEVTRRVACQTS